MELNIYIKYFNINGFAKQIIPNNEFLCVTELHIKFSKLSPHKFSFSVIKSPVFICNIARDFSLHNCLLDSIWKWEANTTMHLRNKKISFSE